MTNDGAVSAVATSKGPAVNRVLRLASPTTLALALLLFVLPFLSVSCDSPGGYGRMSSGGTTSYSGVDLAFGSAPSIDQDHLRPAAERQSDDIGVQPVVTVAALAIAAALALAFFTGRNRRFSAVLAAVGAALLVIGTLLARSSLVDRVAEQSTVPFAQGKSAGDYVGLGIGFWVVPILALIGAALGALSSRRTSADDQVLPKK
jgi:hypothetical protein